MDEKLTEIIRIAKSLHGKGLIYINDNIDLQVEPNYKILATIIEGLNLTMGQELYASKKNKKQEIIYQLALLNFQKDEAISKADIEFMEGIIKEYVDIEEPVFIEDTYVFTINMDKLQKIHKKALKQSKEGKFKE